METKNCKTLLHINPTEYFTQRVSQPQSKQPAKPPNHPHSHPTSQSSESRHRTATKDIYCILSALDRRVLRR